MSKSFEEPIFLVQSNEPADQPKMVADKFVEFISKAKQSIHIAIYDFQLEDDIKTKVVDALIAKANAGVEVLIAYDHTKANEGKVNKGNLADDQAPRGTQEFVMANFPDHSNVQCTPIAGNFLMHNKYIILDAGSADAAVWMGSANFTTGAWTFQENNILRIHSKDLADCYEKDFQDLWSSGNIKQTGINDYASVQVGDSTVEVAFSPGEGSAAASLFVDAIQGANKKIWIATMVLTSGPILGALSEFLEGGGAIEGVYDKTQMSHVERTWDNSGSNKLALWDSIKVHLKGKHSTPFSEHAVHDFMHNKILLTDKTVVTGSFNLSENAERNAENVLSIKDAQIVNQYKGYMDTLLQLSKSWGR